MDEDSGLQQELELLEAIYLEDFSADRSDSGEVECVRVQIQPATGDNPDEKYVCLTLEFSLSEAYPDEVPEMAIRNPRGLADEHVMKLRQDLRNLAEERTGMPMLYELIELGKESLTESNIPHGQCVICLELLAAGEAFTKTECYHYFHNTCLLRYLNHCHEQMEHEREEIRQHKHMTLEKKDIVCPVCREPIDMDIDVLKSAVPEAEPDTEVFVVSDEIRMLQHKMAVLYAAQQAKGGIIDVEAERNKFLIPSEEASSSNLASAHTSQPIYFKSQLNSSFNPVVHNSDSFARGKGRGRPLSGKSSERPGGGKEQSNLKNFQIREKRQREAGRGQGLDRGPRSDDKQRPGSSGSHHRRDGQNKGFRRPESSRRQENHSSIDQERRSDLRKPERESQERRGHIGTEREVYTNHDNQQDLGFEDQGERPQQPRRGRGGPRRDGPRRDSRQRQTQNDNDLTDPNEHSQSRQRWNDDSNQASSNGHLDGYPEEDRRQERPGQRYDNGGHRRWSGRGRGRNHHNKPRENNGPPGGEYTNRSNQQDTDNHDFDSERSSIHSNDQRKPNPNRRHYTPRPHLSESRRGNAHHSDCDTTAHNRDSQHYYSNSSNNPQGPPPGFRKQRPPPGFTAQKPRAPPGFEDGR